MSKKTKMNIRSKMGEFSVKGLAITVGTIVVIGAVVSWLSGNVLTDWIEEVWVRVWGWIQDSFMS